MKYYDKKNNRLVFTGQRATSEFWDKQWNVQQFKKSILSGLKNRLIIKTTRRFIRPNKNMRILEGGCGNGQFVYAFDKLGYNSYGVDYAENTICKTLKIFPDLKISCGDINKLNFYGNYFDGYWSIGVIEHFIDGYKPSIDEMKRVIKPGGYLFITFPYLSLLRKLKIKLGKYPEISMESVDRESFYQFALDYNSVINNIAHLGFRLIKKRSFAGTKGLKDEIKFFRPIFQKIYDSDNIFLKILNYGMSVFFSPLCGHSILLVFQKK